MLPGTNDDTPADLGYQDINDIPLSPLAIANNVQGQSAPGNSASPLNNSNITDLLMNRAQDIAPSRPEVLAKREALQNAYQKLIQAQAYQEPPTDLAAYRQAYAMANIPVPGGGVNGNLLSGIAGNLARAEEEYNQQNLRERAAQEQANTRLGAMNEALKETQGDSDQTNDLIKQAGLTEYRNAMMGAKLNKPVKLPDGSEGMFNLTTGTIVPVTDRNGNPIKNIGVNYNGTSNNIPNFDPDKTALASQLGVPLAPPTADPTKGMTPQGRSTYVNKLQTSLQKNNENNQQIQDQLTQLDHFTQENANQKTGGWRNIPIISSIIASTNPAYQTMNSLNKTFSVGPGMRPQGMRITQGEWNVFRQAVASTQNTPEANLNIANAMKAKLQRDMDYNNFMSDYVTANGHGQLADNYFNQYMKDNPIFAPDANSKNNYQLNPDRMSYQEYFAKKGLTGALPTSSQLAPNAKDSGEIAAQTRQGLTSAIRNNNPGNVRNGPNGTFAPAETPEQGIATTASNLLAYNDKHGINTVQDIVKRWAPPVDTVTGRSNNTPAYIADVSKRLGVAPDQPLNIRDPQVLYNLTTAMIHHENSSVPYHPLQIAEGVNMALKKSQQQRLESASPQEIADELRRKGIIQ